MTDPNPAGRVHEARAVAARLAALIAGEGRQAQPWLQRLQQITAILDTDDRENLVVAADRFDSLYAGGRNFADFHLWRTDPDQRIVANEQLTALTDQLRDLLHQP